MLKLCTLLNKHTPALLQGKGDVISQEQVQKHLGTLSRHEST